MNITETLNKTQIYTFVGKFINEDNTLITPDGIIIDCIIYRHLRRESGQDLICVNMKYITGFVNAWVIFQIVRME